MNTQTFNTESTALSLLHPTGSRAHAELVIENQNELQQIEHVAIFIVCLTNDRSETVTGATAYQPEGPLTTFFAANSSRGVIDSWAKRVASFRTADLVSIRREIISSDVVGHSGELVGQAA